MVEKGGISNPWEMVCVYLVGRLTKSSRGFMYILTVADFFTNFLLGQQAQVLFVENSRTTCFYCSAYHRWSSVTTAGSRGRSILNVSKPAVEDRETDLGDRETRSPDREIGN